MSQVTVRAAGGAVWRRGADGGVEVVLVHRPRYDDWSFPKGKLRPGESDADAALREVREEAGIVARLGPELPATAYLDRSGKHKEVRYWAMTAVSTDGTPDDEVDDIVWASLADARSRLSYPRDAAVLDALAGAIGAAAGISVTGMDHIALRVADVERSLHFYGGMLGLEPVRVDEWRRGTAPFPSVRVDAATIIDLFAARGDADPAAGTLDHFCLVVRPTDLEAVAASGAFQVIDGPDNRFGAQGTGRSLYVRDPDGITVELRHY